MTRSSSSASRQTVLRAADVDAKHGHYRYITCMIVLSGADLVLPGGIQCGGTLVIEGERIVEVAGVPRARTCRAGCDRREGGCDRSARSHRAARLHRCPRAWAGRRRHARRSAMRSPRLRGGLPKYRRDGDSARRRLRADPRRCATVLRQRRAQFARRQSLWGPPACCRRISKATSSIPTTAAHSRSAACGAAVWCIGCVGCEAGATSAEDFDGADILAEIDAPETAWASSRWLLSSTAHSI